MSEKKLLVFLQEEVLQRATRIGRDRRDRRRTTGGGDDPTPRTLSYSSIDGYVSAIASLWATQKALGNNSYEAPRGPLVKALLENQLRGEAKRRRTQYIDRGALTIQDG